MREIHRGTGSFVKGVHEERFRSVVPDAAGLGAEGAVLQESSIILCMIGAGASSRLHGTNVRKAAH